MSHHLATCAVLLSSLVFASSANAGSEINKCIAPSGAVTLTDEPCPANTHGVKVVSAPADAGSGTDAPTAGPRTISVERYASAPMPVRFAPPMRSPAPARGMSLDAATLKAAKANLTLFDMGTQRAQRIAAFP